MELLKTGMNSPLFGNNFAACLQMFHPGEGPALKRRVTTSWLYFELRKRKDSKVDGRLRTA